MNKQHNLLLYPKTPQLTEYPKDISFKYSWRKYQQRVLDDLQSHLADGHLHVIAPPGSGKTVLGLEVAIRLNQPTLILAPTIAIRNQWIQRFCELFLRTTQTPNWISIDIRNPKFMTVVTYQGLHAACNNLRSDEAENDTEEEADEIEIGRTKQPNLETIVKGLQSQHIKTIIVDEAHHLKNEWWHTLSSIKAKLNPTVVGLTATPPYDVTANEWQRYIDLNGPVDTEISVPELILEGDLCPHQDYIYFTQPSTKENQSIVDFRQNIEKLFQEIKHDTTIVQAIENHPFWKNPIDHLEWVYNNISYYSACLIFLNANEKEIPLTHIEIVGDKHFDIPKLDYEWIEILLDFYLFKESIHFKKFEVHQKALENRLRRYGAIEKRSINFLHNRQVTGFLSSSISKLDGIKEIVDFEYKQLGKNLRLVILTDYIRKEFYVNNSENTVELNKIGVIPIFEKLRRANHDNKKIAVLTGSMIIIPANAYPAFKTKTEKLGITQINSSPVPFDNNYILIHQTEQLKHDIVNIITQIFQNDEIEVLIGTKSLLGEGWDAPAINALVLASFIGSFVLSNQMRGRAIRTQKGNENKTGNIWHLVCIDSSSPTGGDDLEILKRRFRSFVGISFKEEPAIENGIGRLNIPKSIFQKEVIEQKNAEMFSMAKDRHSLNEKWKLALQSGNNLVDEIKIPFAEERDYNTTKSMYLYKTIKNLLATLGSGLIGFGIESLQGLGKAARHIESLQDFSFFLAVVGVIGIAIFGRQTYVTLSIFLKYRDIAKDVQKIGVALLNALIKSEVIKTERSKLAVDATVDQWGAVACHLEGGTTFEKSTFINALQEIVKPVDNPRYVIIRKSRFIRIFKQKDYHAVPEILGRNKNLAEYFQSQWEQEVGKCELIFTRTVDGRKLLLKSRIKSLSAEFDEDIEHISKWR